MTADNNPQRRPTFEFDVTPQGIQRLNAQIRQSGYQTLEVNQLDQEAIKAISDKFLGFVEEILPKIGVEYDEVKKPLTLELDQANPNWNEVLKNTWNKRAKAWGWIESPTNYFATFSTLLQYMETDRNPRKKEKIVSLGSGPGLYEAYLMYLLSKNNLEMYCVDFAKEMTLINKKVIKNFRDEKGRMVPNVKPVTGDMTNLEFPDRFFDQIICNNSVQWSPDWKKAVSEMRRVINPEGLGLLYIFINRHPMKIIREDTKEVLLSIGDIDEVELLDTLEANHFEIEFTRQYQTAKGLGQMGGISDRMFVKARLSKDGMVRSWREARVKARSSLLTTPKG